MNIKIPDSWLRDYIDTNAKPADIAKNLSLHAFNVEKIIPWEDGDSIYEIEVTPNRSDVLSICGLARELQAILPLVGFNCKTKLQQTYQIKPRNKYALNVQLKNKNLVPRFSAIVLDNISIAQSPELIRKRLEKVGLRAINNIVDVTNYIMIDRGQPMHSFDFDKIGKKLMKVRESGTGECVTTLDGVVRTLPTGVVVIEDGLGRLIDLCGIMGAQNSEVDVSTKRVLLFVQVYDPLRIRRASMSLGHRTDAALRFEKGIDFDGVLPSLNKAVCLIKQNTQGQEASELIDIVNQTYKQKSITLDYDRLNLIAGITFDKKKVVSSLQSLGFKLKNNKFVVPSWRYNDIDCSEDLAEEVIRLYGYYNIPGKLPAGQKPTENSSLVFKKEDQIKDFLKYQGFFECYTYSATRKKIAGGRSINLVNPLSEDFFALRTSLVGQLMEVINRNCGYSDVILLFEIASTYIHQENDLPLQQTHLAIVTKNIDYLKLKGVIEALYNELDIKQEDINIDSYPNGLLSSEINLDILFSRTKKPKYFTPISRFNFIKEDLTLVVPPEANYSQIVNRIYKEDPRIINVSFSDFYKDSLSLSIKYLDRAKQITAEDVGKIRKNILSMLRSDKIRLKTSN